MNESESSKRNIVPKTSTDIRSVSSNIIRRGLDDFHIKSKQKKIQILIVMYAQESADHIQKLLQFEKDIEFVGSTTSSLQAIDLCKELKPDILISYTHFSEIDGFQLAREIRNVDPQIKVLFLTVHDFLYYIRYSIDLGVKGYFSMPPIGDEFIKAIREIHTNKYQDIFYFDAISETYSLYGDFLSNVQLKRLHGLNSISTGALIQIKHKKLNSYNSPYYRSTSSLILDDIEFLDLNNYQIKEIDFSMIKQMKNLRQFILPPNVLSASEMSWLRSKQGLLFADDNNHENIRRVLYPGNYEEHSS
jgi:DNA-binding NarL/FixJ family response regulator